MSGIRLVEARAGLTNYYQNQVVRNPVMDIDTTIIDELVSENYAGGISQGTIQRAAVYSGGLNAQASGFAEIKDGWNTSRGIMIMTFVTQESPVMVEYMKVIGYVTNNEGMTGLSLSAMFHPTMSWKTQETITSSMDINNPTSIKRNIGNRTDYLFNDGGNLNGNLISLRPSDVIDYTIERATHDDIMQRMEDEGLPGMTPSTTVAGTDISRVGVIASKRQNQNPSKYAEDLLKAGTNYQRNNLIGNGQMDMGYTESHSDGMFGALSDLSYQAGNSEPQILRDNFFAEMMEIMGRGSNRGFTGYSIADLQMAFPDINEVLDLTLMDATQYDTTDYTQNTEGFGTSSYQEFISHEIEANILDLMMRYGLSEISFRGSNCDSFGGDGPLDNITILPYNPMSLETDDFMLPSKIDGFINDLRNQIFAKINGLRLNEMTPIRFDVTAELFGNCIVNIMVVDESNQSCGFSIEDTGIPVGMISRVFPTFAINTTATVLGDSMTAQQAGSNFFSNLEAYFK